LPLVDPLQILSMRRNIQKLTISSLGCIKSILFFSFLEQNFINKKIDSNKNEKKETTTTTTTTATNEGKKLEKINSTIKSINTLTPVELKNEFLLHEISIKKMLSVVYKNDIKLINTFLYELVTGRYISSIDENTFNIVQQIVQS